MQSWNDAILVLPKLGTVVKANVEASDGRISEYLCSNVQRDSKRVWMRLEDKGDRFDAVDLEPGVRVLAWASDSIDHTDGKAIHYPEPVIESDL